MHRRVLWFVFLSLVLSLILSLPGRGLLLASTEDESTEDESIEAEDGLYPQEAYEWEMFTQQVSGNRNNAHGGNSGMVFIYNKRTGQAYRFFPNTALCGFEAPKGCFVAIPGNEPPPE